jgi:hypothetical protein
MEGHKKYIMLLLCFLDLDVGERMILKWILKKQDGRVWTGLIWLKIGSTGVLL